MSLAEYESSRQIRPQAQPFLTPAQQFQRALDTPVVPLIGMMVLFLASFGNLVNLAIDKQNVALDGQVLAKLGVLALCGIYGAYGFLNEPRVRSLILTLPLMWVVTIIALYVVAVPSSVMQTESLASAVSIACVLLMSVTCLVQLGVRTVLDTIFHAVSAFVVLSWLVYFVAPQIGIYREPLPDGQFAVRMSGLAHPNTLGQFSGLLIVIACIQSVRDQPITKWRIAMVLLAAGALIGSLSRTSLLATIVAVAVVYRRQILRREYFVFFVWVALIGSVALMVFGTTGDLGDKIESKLALLSKSGDTSELTSATGRAEIWAKAISMIRDQPLTGYGAATSKIHLADYSLYTHNLILNIAFSCGVLGGLAAICMCLGRVRALLFQPHVVADGLLAFILVNGLFENVIFANLAGMPTIVWIVALCLPGLDYLNANDPNVSPAENGGVLSWNSWGSVR